MLWAAADTRAVLLQSGKVATPRSVRSLDRA